ncbi:MAG: hypothetical protein KGL39_03135 [Patescibacteria group bacterium]|nr:hypothetical protein [Patescibacteria group bacterium]
MPSAPAKPFVPPPKHPLLTVDEFAVCVASVRWQDSTSARYKDMPHSYHVREWTRDMVRFDRMVEHIRVIGFPHRFFKRVYIYLLHDGWYYWTMGWPVHETTVINRARKLI